MGEGGVAIGPYPFVTEPPTTHTHMHMHTHTSTTTRSLRNQKYCLRRASLSLSESALGWSRAQTQGRLPRIKS